MKLMHSVCLGLLGLGALCAATISTRQDELTVHEWGTFTSVAGAAGESVVWQPLASPPDLPCFVNRLSLSNLKGSSARVRMETPVIYFYASRPMPVSVRVRFPLGMITEWYPRATSVEPSASLLRPGMAMGWDAQLLPGTPPGSQPSAQSGFPLESRASHYYAARETDAAPLRVGDQHEKLIFYRGIGDFSVPLRPRFTSAGRLTVANVSADPIPAAILFQNRSGAIGWRMLNTAPETTAEMAPLSGDIESLRQELEKVLTSQGLYPKEARAMLETWRDSWFEEGTRVLYIVPRAMVDAVLPLSVDPPPAAMTRVFVGRVEMMSPAMKEEIEQAVAADQPAPLEKYGRFLQPFLMGRQPGPRLRAFVAAAWNRALAQTDPAACH